jgi:hypothetical protein
MQVFAGGKLVAATAPSVRSRKYGPPNYAIDPNWRKDENAVYWVVATPHGQLEINCERINQGPVPYYDNNMWLDCFEIGRLLKAMPEAAHLCPAAWKHLRHFADTNEQEYLESLGIKPRK